MITKKEIREEIKELKILKKAINLCFSDFDLQIGLIVKMAHKYIHLIDECLKRKLHDFEIEELENLKKDIKIHLKGENDIYTTEKYDLLAVMNSGFIIIDVMVL